MAKITSTHYQKTDGLKNKMTNDRRDRFSRLFPARVEKIRNQLRILGNCSNKLNYEWDQDKIKLFFAYILQEFISLANSFGIPVTAEVAGKDVHDY